MCELYLDQQALRGIDTTVHLVKICLKYSGRLIAILPERKKPQWRAKVIETKARLVFVEATTPKPSINGQAPPPCPNVELLDRSIDQYKEALALSQKLGATQHVTRLQPILANCYQLR